MSYQMVAVAGGAAQWRNVPARKGKWHVGAMALKKLRTRTKLLKYKHIEAKDSGRLRGLTM